MLNSVIILASLGLVTVGKCWEHVDAIPESDNDVLIACKSARSVLCGKHNSSEKFY